MRAAVLATVWRARWVALVAALVGGVGGYLLASLLPATYTAQSQVILAQTENFDPLQQRSFSDPTRHAADQAATMLSQPVLQSAAARLDGVDSDTLAASVTATPNDGSNAITVAADAPTPTAAAEQADAVVAAYRQQVAERVAIEAAAAARATTLPATADTIRTSAVVYGDGVAVVVPAATPTAPTSPQPLRIAIGVAVLAALVAMGLHAWYGHRRADLTRLTDAAQAPILGVLPTRRRPAPDEGSASRPAAMTLVALDYARRGRPGAVLFSGVDGSADAGEVVMEVGSAAAREGRRVAVVNSRPSSPEGRVSPSDAPLVRAFTPAEPGAEGAVSVVALPTGSVEVGDGTSEQDLQRLSESFELVLVQLGPVTYSPTALAAARQAAAVVAVIDIDADPILLTALMNRLAAAGCSLSGLVVTDGRLHGAGRIAEAYGAAVEKDPAWHVLRRWARNSRQPTAR